MEITDEMRIALERAMIDSGRETDAMIAAVAPMILQEAAKAVAALREVCNTGEYREGVLDAESAIRALNPSKAVPASTSE